jgi:hypothetical protein
MPIYEYRDPASGLMVEEFRQIPDRDRPATVARAGKTIHLPRVTVPRRLGIVGIRHGYSQAEDVLEGYRQAESKGTLRRSEFTPDEIKRIWARPDNE